MAKWFIIFGFAVVSPLVLGATLVDPTAPPGFTSTASAPVKAKAKVARLPQLSAIFKGTEQPGAVLNQQFVALGDVLQGYRLTKVADNYVILVRNKKQFRIRLDKVSVKQPVQ